MVNPGLAAAGKGLTGFLGSGWKVIVSIFSLVFLRWKITITLIFLAFFLGNAAYESFAEGSYRPIVFKAGGLILSADEQLHSKVLQIEENDWRLPSKIIDSDEEEGNFIRDFKSIWAKTMFLLEIVGAGWFIFISGLLLFKGFQAINNQSKIASFILTILVLGFLQAGYSLSLLYLDYDCGIVPEAKCFDRTERLDQVTWSLVPLKGLGSVVWHLGFTGNLWKNTFLKSAISFDVQNETSPLNESLNFTMTDF